MATDNTCDSGRSQRPLEVDEARALLLEHARPVAEQERLALDDALGRVLATPLDTAVDMPNWDNSAMDGYAIRAADLAARGGRLHVAQRIAAGSSGEPLLPGTAARIFTGAPVPEGADTVVVQEVCERDADSVLIPSDIKPGANIRRRGEELRAGERVIEAGTRLRPQHLALAASVGADRVDVYRPLRVAIFASGDELVSPGEPLEPGKIYNSNRSLFRALLSTLGCEIIDLGTVEDTLAATMAALVAGASRADLVLASGGVSVGEEDHVKPAVERLGALSLWQVAMRPGKPLAFGHLGDTPFIGSPGNPVSLFVTFCLFAKPFIARMQGVQDVRRPLTLPVAAGFDWPKPQKRTEYHRARIDYGPDGRAQLQLFHSRSSAALTSLTWADGLALIPAGHTFSAGTPIGFIPLDGLLG
jgi:molybdopterin molybdotransferase